MKNPPKTILAFISMFFFLISCDNEEERSTEKLLTDPKIEFYFTKIQFEPQAGIKEDMNFTNGDQIELFVVSEERRHFLLTMKDGKWIPQITRGQLGKGDIPLVAFYPANMIANQSFSLPVDQNVEESHKRADLLHSDFILKDEKQVINMQFRHALQRLIFKLLPKSGSLPSSLEVQFRTKTNADVDMNRGSLIAREDSSIAWIVPKCLSDGLYSAFVLPQSTEGYRGQDWINIKYKNQTTDASFPNEVKIFESGKSEEVTLEVDFKTPVYKLKFDPQGGVGEMPPIYLEAGESIFLPKCTFVHDHAEFRGWGYRADKFVDFPKEGGVLTMQDCDTTLYAYWTLDMSEGGASKIYRDTTLWAKGIKVSPVSDWEQFATNSYTLPWKVGLGWYDVSQGSDQLCWAATACNILHWWFDQNSEYIERYGKCYKGPENIYVDSFHSSFYQLFRESWPNRGNYPQVGFSWFLVGSESNIGGGYFKDVFGNNNLAESIRNPVRRTWNEWLERGFRNNMMMGMIIPFLGRAHECTIWGARFDKEGFVDRIYYTNSNDGKALTFSGREVGMLYKDIIYKNGSGEPMFESSVAGSYISIRALQLFSLLQDFWEAFFTNW